MKRDRAWLILSGSVYGFRAPASGAPRNDKQGEL
jgi:hypothetical protein